MSPKLDWSELMKIDPEVLPGQEKLADKLLDSLSKVESSELIVNDPPKLVQLFKITQSLMKMKAQEVELAMEEVERAGEEQAKIESHLKAKILKLENELEEAQMASGGRDTRFLRNEIRQQEQQLEHKDKELAEMEKELNKEKKANEKLTLQAEEAEKENGKLKRENEQLRQDVIDYQKQIDSQRETLLSRRGDDSDIRAQLSKKNKELYEYLDDIQTLTEANEKLDVQNQEMQKNLEDSVLEMEKMTNEYNKMKVAVQQTDISMDQLRKENEHLKLQVQELTEQLHLRMEEDDPVMAAVNIKVEEWKRVLSAKDNEIIEYQHMLIELKEKLKAAQLDSDKANVMALQQAVYELCDAVQERDLQIKVLTDQVEQCTIEMEKNAHIVEDLKNQLQKDAGFPSAAQQKRTLELQTHLHLADQKLRDMERVASLAESDAREKDKELSEALARMRAYEAGEYGLENAVAEIKDYKNQVKVRDHEIESLTKEINKLEMKISDLLDENEDFRDRLGLNPKDFVDLTEFRRTKALRQQQYRAENQVLLKEIERLEDERLQLKKYIRGLVKQKGKVSVFDDFMAMDNIADSLKSSVKDIHVSNLANQEEIKQKNEHLLKKLNSKQKELELKTAESVQLESKLKQMSEENKQLEQGMREILQAVKEAQKDSRKEMDLHIPTLERLVHAIEMKNSDHTFDANVYLKAQVDQLTGRNDELRREIREARKEAANASNQLEKAVDRAVQVENEIKLLKQTSRSGVALKAHSLPDEIVPSSAEIINSLNEYIIGLLQELHNKEECTKKLEGALEEYKRKFAVIRHQQGLLYKEYQSERELWEQETRKNQELKNQLQEQKVLDDVKIQEYNHWLDVMQMDSEEIKKQVAEAARKMTILLVNEKSLTRRYTTLLEMEQHLRKENNKLRSETASMESAVVERIGYLQRYKDMAAFRIASLQKSLDKSVSSAELEKANKQFNDLTIKYRDLLQKDNMLVQKAVSLEHLEGENAVFRSHIDHLNKELEITKEKLYTLEQSWEHINKLGAEGTMDKATKAIANSEILSISKKITMLEMKELNERQRAEHAHKMYECLRNSLKQVEERNFELENKFSEVTKQNLEAQKVEQELRDALTQSVSKDISDADRASIIELEKSEATLNTEVSKLREIADIAKAQVIALEARQLSREKEVEALRKQVLDYQAQSDEKALIAKLHQHIVALQVSEATAVSKLEVTVTKLQKLEAYNLRLEQKIDDKEQALYYARQEGRNRAKHLQQTVQSLRRQFSGALPLPQQEKFSKTMIQLQNDKVKIHKEMQRAEEERRKTEDKMLELELKLKGLEELISTLKDARGAQKVSEWHKKMEELRLQEQKQNRELGRLKEEIKYLKNVIAEQEQAVCQLEEELVQQSSFHEERQLCWDQREAELERQLDLYQRQHNEVLSTAQKFEEATGSVPDPSLPLPQQLDMALRKIKEHVRTILETKAACKNLEEKIKEKEASLWKAEQNVLSRDRVINELRLHLPATSESDKLIDELKKKDDNEYQKSLNVAQQAISSLQVRLNQKEDIIKKYQHMLTRSREEQEEIGKKHEEELRLLHQKLDMQSDTSLNKFKQSALELLNRPSFSIPTTKHLARLAEMEQTVAEQDNSISVLSEKLQTLTLELEKQKQITILKMKEHENEKSKIEERHMAEVNKLKESGDELRGLLTQMEKETNYLRTELEAQKEANTRAPTSSMKNLVERLKAQLALKEKQQKALSKALLELRSEMTAHAEQQIITNAAQKEENLNIQQLVDKHTKDMKLRLDELTEQLLTTKENLKALKNKEGSLKGEIDDLNLELQKNQKALSKVQTERDELVQENEELKKKIKRLSYSMQARSDGERKMPALEELQKKIKRLEAELANKVSSENMDKKAVKDDKAPKEELIRWEEGKKWQTKNETLRNKLKEKEKEVESLTKQLATMKDLYSRLDQEKASLQRKVKSQVVTVDQVVGVQTREHEKEVEDLKRRNVELEIEISNIRQKQALPRDTAVEHLSAKNRFLEEKVHALERQLSKETNSRTSTSGVGSDSQSQRYHDLQKENLKLSSENVELHFQLEQANKDFPRLKDQVDSLKEMCELLKKEKMDLERKLGNVRGSGRSGKSVPELEKTIGLMKKVVERVQRENDELKKASTSLSREKRLSLENENEKLKAEVEKLKLEREAQVNMKLESKTKGMEKVLAENERLRKELKKETETAEKLKIEKNNLEILNEKMMTQLEETNKRLYSAENRELSFEGANSKSSKSIVVTRMYENKMKQLEDDISKKNKLIADLQQLLQEGTRREQLMEKDIIELKQQIELLKHFPEEAKTESGRFTELQNIRLKNSQLETENSRLTQLVETFKKQMDTVSDGKSGTEHTGLLEKGMKHDELSAKLVELQSQLRATDLQKRQLEDEVKNLRKELENFDPAFFEEIEDLKYNYNEEVKRNILLEEQIKNLSEQIGVQANVPPNDSME
ncbi:centrosomal protein of 290 kDa-like isoform X1 [Polypterus senegalus]|uniref:centrosomal protein of 290 kDa-like isoform X1 n=1 Tax=Polypterus senegalus TaxID=55291 RepID=UPI001962A7DB|nr:centrosomal protein of 290 kDa-like isoform X1 [Polypterus senegalus]